MTLTAESPFIGDPLTAIQCRALGCLIEKQALTPETYPLTLNALVSACNQKTSREPVMNAQPGEIGQALRLLEGRQLVHLIMGSRADRWEHRVEKNLELVQAQTALLGLLLLRGPQTLNELWSRSSRLFSFEEAEQVQHHLERLISRGLCTQIPRQSGQREDRYMHLLGSEDDFQSALNSSPSAAPMPADDTRTQQLEQRIDELEQRLARLEQTLGA